MARMDVMGERPSAKTGFRLLSWAVSSEVEPKKSSRMPALSAKARMTCSVPAMLMPR